MPDRRLADRADVPALARSLAAAFEDDPIFGWLIPRSAPRRRARLTRFFAIELAHYVLPGGEVWTTDELPGASLSMPPDRWRVPVTMNVLHGPGFMRVFGQRTGHALALITMMEQKHIREPHHYFPYIGVAPASQGRGLGSALMAPTLERCDTSGLPAYLEATSERNAQLYARLGFEPLAELSIFGSPPLRLMRRPAPSPAAR
jgi:GNAT superfamily N-acetyltransferase